MLAAVETIDIFRFSGSAEQMDAALEAFMTRAEYAAIFEELSKRFEAESRSTL